MLTGLPKLADRNFVIGFLIPTLLAALALLGLLSNIPVVEQTYTAIWHDKKWEDITSFALGVWVVSILIMLLNHSFYRIAEGYVGPFAWIAADRGNKKRAALLRRRDDLIAQEKDQALCENQKRAISSKIDKLYLKLATRFPDLRFPALPTRFGNVIRAFESYPPVVYGADSIPTWTRLTAVMSKQYNSAIADTRAEVNFFLNAFVLGCVVALVALACLFISLIPVHLACCPAHPQSRWFFVEFLAGSLFVAWLGYEAAIWRAAAWGELVKSAFDVYLPALARQLGYELPRSQNERRMFWEAFNVMAVYYHSMDPSLYPPAQTVPQGIESDKTTSNGSKQENGDKDETIKSGPEN
jgi:hypothetical protein